ncbi:IRS1 [Bugula neritina]|uniref:IRS1 n=1 Tax=Bugula neritina TaxID=10212 RepID=A0A7J7KGQ5_BUGNE|nr:IRS1 [Bugula neritina]
MVQLVSPKRFSSNYSPNMDFSESHKPSTVCKQALLRKVKTNKHKYFVLHKESAAAPARLEYYHSESHWHKKKKAKRTIYLKACFSINAFTDTKVKYGINIFTNDDSFQIGFESEQMRDMWLADVRLLSHTSAHQIHNIVKDQTWHVQVQAGSVALPIKGDFELRVSEKLVSLESKDAAKNMYILPLDVIINCLQHGRCCGIEVNENAVTGAGQIWLTLEDELIAHDVCRVLVQNKSLSSPGVDTFRPVSRSLSYKDRHSAFRVRTGSDVRQSHYYINHYPLILQCYANVVAFIPANTSKLKLFTTNILFYG